MGVDLRRRQRSVPEQLLHHAQVGTAGHQVGRERVAQRMRRAGHRDAGAARRVPDQPVDPEAVQLLAVARQEQPAVVAAARRQPRPQLAAVVLDQLQRVRRQRHQPFLVALAAHPHHAPLRQQRVEPHADHLGHPCAGRVEDVHDGAIARCQRAFGDRLEQSFDAASAQHRRQTLLQADAEQAVGGVVGDHALGAQEPEEPADRRDRSHHRRRRVVASQLGHVAQDGTAIGQRRCLAEQPRQVAPVGGDGVRRQL